MRAGLLRSVSAIGLLAGAPCLSFADPITTAWTGAGNDANWDTSANWTNGVPTSTEAATVNTGGGGSAGSLTIGSTPGSRVNVSDGTSLSIGTSLTNNGLLTRSGSYYGATLSLNGTTITGSAGAIALGSGSDHLGGSGIVTNVDSTIHGAGNLGRGQIGLINQSAGLVDANVSGQTLNLQASPTA